MMSIPHWQDLGYFLIALAVLIAVHELGHFLVARQLGVRVLRFSLGLGRPLLRYQRGPDGTEYVLSAIPLGGYVKMLDEREAEVPAEQVHLAFNRQVLWRRAAIVAAGPLANFLFAILAYWVVFMAGETGLRATVGTVEPGSVAAAAGFQTGDQMLSVGSRPATIWEHALDALLAESGSGEDLPVRVRDANGREQERWLNGERLVALADRGNLLLDLGVRPHRPALAPVIGDVVSGEAAQQAGLRSGDRVLRADGEPVPTWEGFVERVQQGPGQPIQLQIDRGGVVLDLSLIPRPAEKDGATIGRIGAGVQVERVAVHYDTLGALRAAWDKTWDMTRLTVRTLGRMLVGQASVDNLSGPISMAKVAGKTASTGWESFIKFLAVVSVSLAVLNLLPIPVLDGGHLVFFFVEWVKGGALSEEAQLQGQRLGLVLIAAIIGLAVYVDLSRLFG